MDLIDLPGADGFLASTHDAPATIKAGVLATSLHVVNTRLAQMMRDGKMPIDIDIMARWRRDCDQLDMMNGSDS